MSDPVRTHVGLRRYKTSLASAKLTVIRQIEGVAGMASDDVDVSRRAVTGALGVGLTGLAAPSSGTTGQREAPSVALQDPKSKYPKPPFPEQRQPWPGLASRMQPVPDHGES